MKLKVLLALYFFTLCDSHFTTPTPPESCFLDGTHHQCNEKWKYFMPNMDMYNRSHPDFSRCIIEQTNDRFMDFALKKLEPMAKSIVMEDYNSVSLTMWRGFVSVGGFNDISSLIGAGTNAWKVAFATPNATRLDKNRATEAFKDQCRSINTIKLFQLAVNEVQNNNLFDTILHGSNHSLEAYDELAWVIFEFAALSGWMGAWCKKTLYDNRPRLDSHFLDYVNSELKNIACTGLRVRTTHMDDKFNISAFNLIKSTLNSADVKGLDKREAVNLIHEQLSRHFPSHAWAVLIYYKTTKPAWAINKDGPSEKSNHIFVHNRHHTVFVHQTNKVKNCSHIKEEFHSKKLKELIPDRDTYRRFTESADHENDVETLSQIFDETFVSNDFYIRSMEIHNSMALKSDDDYYFYEWIAQPETTHKLILIGWC
uniref:Uncharacterized protein n=1 Tax=Plectus sambesii TaxID=2011161 RepID=A0A914X7U7_9BILA